MFLFPCNHLPFPSREILQIRHQEPGRILPWLRPTATVSVFRSLDLMRLVCFWESFLFREILEEETEFDKWKRKAMATSEQESGPRGNAQTMEEEVRGHWGHGGDGLVRAAIFRQPQMVWTQEHAYTELISGGHMSICRIWIWRKRKQDTISASYWQIGKITSVTSLGCHPPSWQLSRY